MKRDKLNTITVSAYFAILLCFTALIACMGIFEHNDVFQSRDFGSFHTILPDTQQTVSDPSAPVGVRRVFTLTVPDCSTNESCLAFYLVHHYAEVWVGEELVYSLTPGENNYITDSPSSDWVILPLYPSDSGRQISVILTPAYESVIGRKVEFAIGSRYAIVMNQLQADLPQFILSSLCILVGLLLILAQLYMAHRVDKSEQELLFLGIFTLLVGIWRITDTRSSPILFPQNPMLMGYITISALFLIAAPLLLYTRTRYRDSEKPLLIAALVCCGFSAAALLCQICDWADLREILPLSHITLIIALVILVWICLIHIRRGAEQAETQKMVFLLAVGFLMDITCYYVVGSSSNILFSILALLIYSVTRFASSILSSNRKAYTDLNTGLFNRNRWDELMRRPISKSDTIGIIMLDLNHLKYINDTMGHEAGDMLIQHFANILRNTIPASNTICRWGGDEFTAMISNASPEIMEQYITAVANAAEQYNTSGGSPKIHYAAGWVLSSEFPELSTEELLMKADQRMYRDKQQWYSHNQQDGGSE